MSEVQSVTIDLQTAKALYELYKTCGLADRHFQKCQNDLFRRHIKATAEARNVSSAFDTLKELIDLSEG